MNNESDCLVYTLLSFSFIENVILSMMVEIAEITVELARKL